MAHLMDMEYFTIVNKEESGKCTLFFKGKNRVISSEMYKKIKDFIQMLLIVEEAERRKNDIKQDEPANG